MARLSASPVCRFVTFVIFVACVSL